MQEIRCFLVAYEGDQEIGCRAGQHCGAGSLGRPNPKASFNDGSGFCRVREVSLITTSRLSSGRKTKARQGGYAGGKAPIGYKAERDDKALTLDEEKASTVRRVFELRYEKHDASLKKIADILSGEGYTTKEGRQFHPMQVKRILDRKAFYEGIYRYSGVEAEGQHQAIIWPVIHL